MRVIQPPVLLDLDRTLVDLQSFTDYDAAWAQVRTMVDPALAEAGPATAWSSSTRACMGVVAALRDEDLWSRVSAAIAVHERAAVPQSVPMPGAGAFLGGLGERPRAVVTLLPVEVARETLAVHGLEIDVVVGRDPRIRPKPSGDGLRRALELLGAGPGGAVMVGDSSWDAAAAADAGVAFVGVHSGPAEFADSFPDVPVRATLADVLELLPRR
jgi:phosphoglycolate phosphatase-like HAD superfamily hydrolase